MMDYRKEIEEILDEMDDPEGGGKMNWDGEYTEKILALISKAKQEQLEEIREIAWKIHVDEDNKEMEAWNHSLDLLIFKLNSKVTYTCKLGHDHIGTEEQAKNMECVK